MSTISPSWRCNYGSIIQVLQNWIAHLEHARQKTISQTIKIECAITQWEVALLLNSEKDLIPTCIYRCKIGCVRSLPLLRSIGKTLLFPGGMFTDVGCPPNTLRKFPPVVYEISGNVQNGWMRRYSSSWDLAFISILSYFSKMHLYDIWKNFSIH
jgi:hypothetical protein